MSFILSPNMNLPVPVVGQEPGPQYATDVNNSLAIIDQHNHTPGSGVQITPSGLNINSNLTIQGNSITFAGALTFQAVLTDAVANSLYEKGVDLYYRDGSGNVIRITQSGSVAGSSGTITGLPSGTASASYSAGTFTFQSSTNTSANIDAGSYIFRNNVASSPGLTLQPPTLGGDYSLTLPTIPGSSSFVTLDTSGNLTGSIATAGGISGSNIGSQTITGFNVAAQTITGFNIAMATIGGANIGFRTITSSNIEMNTNLAGNSVQAGGHNIAVSNTNAAASLSIVRGGILMPAGGGAASIAFGEGFSLGAGSSGGQYIINFSTAFGGVPAVSFGILQTNSGFPDNVYVKMQILNTSQIQAAVLQSGTSYNTFDVILTFIAIGIVA